MTDSSDWSPLHTARVGRNLRVLLRLNLGAAVLFAVYMGVLIALNPYSRPSSDPVRWVFAHTSQLLYVSMGLAFIFYTYRLAKDLERFGVGWAMATAVSGLLVIFLPLFPAVLTTHARTALQERGMDFGRFGPEVSVLKALEEEEERPPSSVA